MEKLHWDEFHCHGLGSLPPSEVKVTANQEIVQTDHLCPDETFSVLMRVFLDDKVLIHRT